VKVVSLGEIATIDRKTVKPEDIVSGTTYVGLENIVSGGEFTSVRPVAKGELASGKFAFDDRHILYGKLRPYLAKIAAPPFSGVCSTDILPIRVGSSADKMFVAHFLRQAHIVDQVNGLAAGANLPRISPTALVTIQLPLPPLEEQRRIAAILDKADGLRTKRREALAHLEALTQSIFHSMFGDLRTDVPWSRVAIGEVCSAIVDCVNRTAPLADGPTPFKMIRTSNVRSRAIDLSNVRYVDEETFKRWNRRTTPQMGDLVLTREAPMGEAGVIRTSDQVFLGQRTMLYRPNPSKLESTYLLYFLTSEFMQSEYLKNGSGSTVKHLSVPYCRSFDIFLPPLELQRTFATRVAAVERLKEIHRKHLAELDALFASLQYRAFKGEL
jgi:type I restriction enzyme, S subunit